MGGPWVGPGRVGLCPMCWREPLSGFFSRLHSASLLWPRSLTNAPCSWAGRGGLGLGQHPCRLRADPRKLPCVQAFALGQPLCHTLRFRVSGPQSACLASVMHVPVTTQGEDCVRSRQKGQKLWPAYRDSGNASDSNGVPPNCSDSLRPSPGLVRG